MSAITFTYSQVYSPSAPVVTATLRRQREISVSVLIDTGADASIFPINVLQRIGAQYIETREMRSVTGHVQIINLYLIEIQVGSQRIPGIRAAAAKPGAEAIIGRDVLNHLIVTLDGIADLTEIS